MGVVVTMIMVMSMIVVMIVEVSVSNTMTNRCLPELAHLTIHLHLSQLSLNFSLS